MKKARLAMPRSSFFLVVGIGLTLLTGFGGGAPLRVLHRLWGRAFYWFVGLVLSLAAVFIPQLPLSAAFLGPVWVLIGLYSDLESRGWGWVRAGLISLGFSFLFLSSQVGILLHKAGYGSWEKLVELTKSSSGILGPAMQIEPEVLASQLPAALMIFLILCLATALIFEKMFVLAARLPQEKFASGLDLLKFRVPDQVIWVFLLGLLLTLVQKNDPRFLWVGMSLLNVTLVLYFFQGVAVLESLLNVLRAGLLTRVLVYMVSILLGGLFQLLGLVGLVDYWLDFRGRFGRLRSTPGGGRNVGSQ